MKDAERQEWALHKRFAQFQRLADGEVGHEWFDPNQELLEFIVNNSIPPEQLGLPRHVSKRND